MSNFQGIFWSLSAEDKNGNIRGEFKRSDVTSRFQAQTSKKYTTFVKGLVEPVVGDFLEVNGLGQLRVIEVSRSSIGFTSCALEVQQYSDVLVAALTRGSKSDRIWEWEMDNVWSHLQRLNEMANGGVREEWINPGQRDNFLSYHKSKRSLKDPFAN